MQFAKLFTYPEGQLLVTTQELDEEEGAACHLLVYETRHAVVTMQMRAAFQKEQDRDAAFAAVDEVKALEVFLSQHSILLKAAA